MRERERGATRLHASREKKALLNILKNFRPQALEDIGMREYVFRLVIGQILNILTFQSMVTEKV